MRPERATPEALALPSYEEEARQQVARLTDQVGHLETRVESLGVLCRALDARVTTLEQVLLLMHVREIPRGGRDA